MNTNRLARKLFREIINTYDESRDYNDSSKSEILDGLIVSIENKINSYLKNNSTLRNGKGKLQQPPNTKSAKQIY